MAEIAKALDGKIRRWCTMLATCAALMIFDTVCAAAPSVWFKSLEAIRTFSLFRLHSEMIPQHVFQHEGVHLIQVDSLWQHRATWASPWLCRVLSDLLLIMQCRLRRDSLSTVTETVSYFDDKQECRRAGSFSSRCCVDRSRICLCPLPSTTWLATFVGIEHRALGTITQR